MEFGRLIDVSHTSVKAYEDGNHYPKHDTMLAIAKVGRIDILWLIYGDSLPEDIYSSSRLEIKIVRSKAYDTRQLEEPNFDNYVSVPLVDAKNAANAHLIRESNIIDHLLLHSRLLNNKKVSDNIVACSISGNSMEPSLADKDIIIIDRGIDKNYIEHNVVYAVYDGKYITANMLHVDGENMFIVPLPPSKHISKVASKHKSNLIVGIVLGAWHNFEMKPVE
ncbi:MAG: S24 family peptidase [Nitrospinota bacterium]